MCIRRWCSGCWALFPVIYAVIKLINYYSFCNATNNSDRNYLNGSTRAHRTNHECPPQSLSTWFPILGKCVGMCVLSPLFVFPTGQSQPGYYQLPFNASPHEPINTKSGRTGDWIIEWALELFNIIIYHPTVLLLNFRDILSQSTRNWIFTFQS